MASGMRRTACWSAWRPPQRGSCGSRRGAPALAGVLAPHGNPAAGVTAAAEQQVRQLQLLQQAQRARPCEGPVAMQSPPRARRLSAGLQSGKELAVRQAWYTLPVRRPQPNLMVNKK